MDNALERERENYDNLDLQFGPWLGTTAWVIECVGENKHRHLVAKAQSRALQFGLSQKTMLCVHYKPYTQIQHTEWTQIK